MAHHPGALDHRGRRGGIVNLAVCRYEKLGDGGMRRAREVYPRHSAYADEFGESGELLLIGTFADPVADGSMGIFLSRDAAERFVASDPFVTEGVVVGWRILDWNADVHGAIPS
jgi:uncharacterized protein YciI